MRPKTAYLFLICVLVSCMQTLLQAQNVPSDPFPSDVVQDPPEDTEATRQTEELVQLKGRLREIESMLLAQKDRENELLRDLNRMLTAPERTEEIKDATPREMREMELRFREEAAELRTKINSLELGLAAGRERDMAMGEQMNKTIVITVATVAGLGLIVFLVTVYLQYCLLSRPVQPLYMQPQPLAFESGQRQLPVEEKQPPDSATRLVENSKVKDVNERFLSAIERLEERILHMESGLARTASTKGRGGFNECSGTVNAEEESQSPGAATPEHDPDKLAAIDKEVESIVSGNREEPPPETEPLDVAVLEEEGKRFLQKEDWETAFQHYDQLVGLDPDRVDNWVNRGRALEMLHREEEAIASYDRAIAANPELPSPFLYKAALLSRMERFEEAQRYYNEALSKVPVQKSGQARVG